MATPAAGSPGDNKAFVDGTVITFPVTVDTTHCNIEFNEVEYVIPFYAEAKTVASSLPVTIDATHDQIEYNDLEYTIAHGVYATYDALAKAIREAVADEDNVTTALLGTVIDVSSSLEGITIYGKEGALRVFGTGAENDALAALGITDTNPLIAIPYPDISTLCAGLNAALDLSTGLVRLDSVVKASPSPFTANAIRFTRAVEGVDTKTIGTGNANPITLSTLGVTDALALASGATATVEAFNDVSLTDNVTPPYAPAITGNGAPAKLTAGTALALPITITAASNDQFEFNELEYIIPAGVYTTAREFVAAAQASANDEDNAGATFKSVVLVDVGVDNKLRFTAAAEGVNTGAFGTGAEHDGLANLGLVDTDALANGS